MNLDERGDTCFHASIQDYRQEYEVVRQSLDRNTIGLINTTYIFSTEYITNDTFPCSITHNGSRWIQSVQNYEYIFKY